MRFIDDEGLIPKKFKNICDYAQSRFKFGRRATNTYLCASYVYESIIEDPSLEIPTNISHIRGLHRYPPEHRRQIWKSATSSNEPITEELVMAHAAKYEMELGAVDKRNEIYIGSELHAIMKKMVPEQIFDLDPAR